MKKIAAYYLHSQWLPGLLFGGTVILLGITPLFGEKAGLLFLLLLFLSLLTFIGLIIATIKNLLSKQWKLALPNLFWLVIFGLFFLLPMGRKNGAFLDKAVPHPASGFTSAAAPNDIHDRFQQKVLQALVMPSKEDPNVTPALPSLVTASTQQEQFLLRYLEAAPEWHIFQTDGRRFACRRWKREGKFLAPANGLVAASIKNPPTSYQTSCLLCLDQTPWTKERFLQKIKEGKAPIAIRSTPTRDLRESNLLIECGKISVEIFEQSSGKERRITKATIAFLEEEFKNFLQNPQQKIQEAQKRSRESAELQGDKGESFTLLNDYQPGLYTATYTCNPSEAGWIYLRAFDPHTKKSLSSPRLEKSSRTRISFSPNSQERFFGQVGFTIYEGDWGKPYAARFELWFKPDSDQPDQKLAERIYKIEGWQR